MARTASGGITITELRDKAKSLFPGKTAQIYRLSKEELQKAVDAGMLPQQAVSSRPVPSVDGASAAQQIALAIESLTAGFERPINEQDVRCIAEDVFESLMATQKPAKSLSIRINDLPAVQIDAQHKQFPVLLALCSARVNSMLVGPAGSGKTSAAHAVANALSLPFRSLSVGPQTSKSDLLGYMDATGKYRGTALREMYEHGGILLLDELDAGNPGVLTTLNALLANGEMTFPDYTVRKHADFVCIAAANTFGTGADRQYVGRNQLDAATLDRFFILEWGYDEGFEASLLGLSVLREYVELRPSGYTAETWFERVTKIRRSVETAKVRHLVSPRASLAGAKLLDCMPRELLEEGLIWKGMPAIQRQQIEGGIR